MLQKIIIIITLFLLMQTHTHAQTEWLTLANSKVTFKIKNAGINTNGYFEGLEANILFSPEKLAQSKITASVKAESIQTGISARDAHLRSDDYFAAKKYPLIKMTSTKFEKKDQAFVGYFDLTIREVTKNIKVPFTFVVEGEQASFKGSFSINRRDFNVGGWSMILGNEADLTLDIKVKKK